MSVNSHNLALSIINDRKGIYGTPQDERTVISKMIPKRQLTAWVIVATRAAIIYTQKHTDYKRWHDYFSISEVISAASEVAEFYASKLTAESEEIEISESEDKEQPSKKRGRKKKGEENGEHA